MALDAGMAFSVGLALISVKDLLVGFLQGKKNSKNFKWYLKLWCKIFYLKIFFYIFIINTLKELKIINFIYFQVQIIFKNHLKT